MAVGSALFGLLIRFIKGFYCGLNCVLRLLNTPSLSWKLDNSWVCTDALLFGYVFRHFERLVDTSAVPGF
jgi:hypothetical protein